MLDCNFTILTGFRVDTATPTGFHFTIQATVKMLKIRGAKKQGENFSSNQQPAQAPDLTLVQKLFFYFLLSLSLLASLLCDACCWCGVWMVRWLVRAAGGDLLDLIH